MSAVYVALDLEMTGPDPERDDIIQVGAVRFDERQVIERWTSPLKSAVPVPLRITRLTGIRPRDLQAAPGFDDVRARIETFVGAHPLVGHSVGNDVRFLRAKELRLANPLYDTHELATLLMPSLAAYGLADVARALNVPPARSHDALADAETSRLVFLALVDKLHDLPEALLAEVTALASGSGWPLEGLFARIAAESARTAFASAAPPGSIRAQLLAKGVREADVAASVLAPTARVQPLEPVAELTPLDLAELQEAFGPSGALAATFDGYEQRPQQVEMTRAVGEAFNEARTLVVEAGTGTGKSLAYLVPAARWALQNGERVIISTDTIALQDQLYEKDIPDVRRALGADGKRLRSTLVKGRSNYLCLRRWEQYRRSGGFTPDEVRFIAKVLLWLPHTTTGDVAELPLSADERAHWQKVCATQGSCTGRRCRTPDGRRCFLFRVRQQAEGAHLVVVNHSLLLSDMAAGGTVLPSYLYLVVDEAHKLEAAATDQLGFSADARSLGDHLDRISAPLPPDRHEGLASRLPVHLRGSRASSEVANKVLALSQTLAERTARVRSRADDLFLTLGPVVAALGPPTGYDRKLRLTASVRQGEPWRAVEGAWESLRLVLEELQAALNETVGVFEQLEDLNVLEYDELFAELQGLQLDTAGLTGTLHTLIAEPREADVSWVSVSGRSGAISLHQAPLHVGPLLTEGLYAEKRALVLTSATLATDRSFAYVEERLGLAEPVRLLVGSPFDYRSAALLLVPSDVPEPNSPGYQRAVEEALVELVVAAGGRTLALFTSQSAVQTTAKAVRRPLGERDILVLAQGDGPRHRLLQQLRSNPRTVLLGTRSFWEGVDVVGDALSLLVIAKLPFEVPSEPVFVARSESFDDPFTEYSVPQAILRLKQGFGRLIRSNGDRGVVVALDRRLLSKSYGPAFLRSLPGATFRKGPTRLLPREVGRWLSMGDGAAAPTPDAAASRSVR